MISTSPPKSSPDNRRPSVLIVIDTRIVGGPGRGLFHFLDCADHSRFSYELCAFRFTKPGSEEFIEEATKRGYNLSVITQSSLLDPRPIWKLWQIWRTERFNLLQTHGYKGHFIAYILTRFVSTKWIAFSHGWTKEDWKVQFYNMIGKWCMRSASCMIAVSEPLAKELRRYSRQAPPPLMIPNGINLEHLPLLSGRDTIRNSLNISASSLLLGCIGRLSSEKGQDILLESFSNLNHNHGECHLLLVGEGPERANLEEQADRLGLKSRVHFVGHQRDTVPFYDAIDTLVIPSRSEGLPNVLLESMAHGKVVVSTPVGEIPTVIKDSENGFLAEDATPESLLKALRRFFECRESLSSIVDRAKDTVRKYYSAKVRAERIIELYEELLRSPK